MTTTAELNDKFRQNPYNGLGRMVATRGVMSLGDEFKQKCIEAVKTFAAFDKGNDSYGEHDFFQFTIDGEDCFFKIDYLDRTLQYGSPNPADPQVTVRIGTIMLADEY